MGGWVNSDRRERLPSNWPVIRKKRLELDNYECQWWVKGKGKCGKPANQVDHKKPKTDDDRIECLQSLCEGHHKLKSAREGNAAYHAAINASKAKFRAPQERHPGSLV